ncbi:hypothetical protein D3C71_1332380 [compost metagenome]
MDRKAILLVNLAYKNCRQQLRARTWGYPALRVVTASPPRHAPVGWVEVVLTSAHGHAPAVPAQSLAETPIHDHPPHRAKPRSPEQRIPQISLRCCRAPRAAAAQHCSLFAPAAQPRKRRPHAGAGCWQGGRRHGAGRRSTVACGCTLVGAGGHALPPHTAPAARPGAAHRSG